MKSIILEGPNGAGKSTLAKQLQGLLGLPIEHATKPESIANSIQFAATQRIDMLVPKIYDRSHAISCLVYQRDKLSKDEYTKLALLAITCSTDAIVIYCTGDGERDMDKPHYTEELKEETKDQKKIRDMYEYVFAILKHQRYNFKIDEISSLQLT